VTWHSWYRQLLEPVGGDRPSHPDRMLRLNLRRVELVAYVGILDAAVEGFLGLFLYSNGLMTVYVIAISGCTVFACVGRRAQRQGGHTVAYLPEAFVVFILACSQSAGFFVALSGRIPSGYAMVFLATAAVFLIPPKRFALIGLLSFLVFSIWVVAIDVSLRDKAVVLFTTGLSIIAGCFGRYGLHRMQVKYERQRVRIARQNLALVTTNDQLQRRNAELNQIMAIAAHDLRSPLFGLKHGLPPRRKRSSRS
jgi:signal transduction histidine kinase